jgi:hypothetical protein
MNSATESVLRGDFVLSIPEQDRPEESSDEYCTPPNIVYAARAAMGGIDLDPASNEQANAIIQAKRFYTVKQNGLTKPWNGDVFANFPFSDPTPFVSKLCHEFERGNVTQAVVVQRADLTKWSKMLKEHASAFCSPHYRVSFLRRLNNGELKNVGQYMYPIQITYLGENVISFFRAFSTIGTVSQPVVLPPSLTGRKFA